MITTVFIDIDDTILDWKKSAKEAISNLFSEHGLPFDPDVTPAAFSSASAPLWAAVERGEITGAQLRKVRWNHVFKELGIDRCDGESFEEDFRKHLGKTDFLVEGADKLLEYLSEKYTVCVASNAYFEQQNARLEKSGLKKYLSHIFTSQEIGYEKPDERFFKVCLELAGSPDPSEVIMIGDSARADVGGGKKMGFKTCWLNRDGKSTDGVPFDYCISSLKELMDIL